MIPPIDSEISAGWEHRTIFYAPLLICLAFIVLLAIPSTRTGALWLLEENHPVELATFVIFLWTGISGFRLSFILRRNRGPLHAVIFYALFSFVMIIIAMEESAWGQCLLGYETPEFISRVNAQDQMTLHNIYSLQGKSELFRLAFGLCGLLGIGAYYLPRMNAVGIPPVLLAWFLIISAHASFDLFNDYFPISKRFDFYMQRSSELVELLIAMAACLYIALNSRRIMQPRKTDTPGSAG